MQLDTVRVTPSIRSSLDVVGDDVHESSYWTVVPVTGGRVVTQSFGGGEGGGGGEGLGGGGEGEGGGGEGLGGGGEGGGGEGGGGL